jgi:hypothetical protein
MYILVNKANNEERWKHTKVCGMFNDIDSICDQLKKDIQRCSNDLTFINSISSSENCGGHINKQESSFMYSQLIRDILVGMEHTRNDCILSSPTRRKHCWLTLIDECEADCCRDKSIWWYTRSCFIYEILNKALRSIIKGLDHQLYAYRLSLTVYRGQAMLSEKFEKHKNNIGGLLSINNFLSISTEKEVLSSMCSVFRILNQWWKWTTVFRIIWQI